MTTDKRSTAERPNDRGVSILIIAVSMVFVLGMAGLAIDLASLYVGRSQAQRAADAAALAGATALVNDSCVTGTTGTGLSAGCMTMARQNAEAVGNANLIAGISPDIIDSDITFPNTSSSDPQVQVVAGRGTYDGVDHGNAMPTFFMKIFGITTASVSATAKAEAYNPSGSSTPIATSCVKPWMFPNCDQFNSTSPPNTACDQSDGYNGGSVGPFVNDDGTVARPLQYPNGAIGEPFEIKPGSPGNAAAPGQFYAAYLPSDTAVPTECPSCATQVSSGGTGSGALYRENIECCNTNELYCGETINLASSTQVTLQSAAGNKVGPTEQGINCLINQDESGGSNCGQDYIPNSDLSNPTQTACDDPTKNQPVSDLPRLLTVPPTVMPGANNLRDPSGTNPIPMSASNSVVVAPIFQGTVTSGQNTVVIAGFVQLFLRDYAKNQQGTVFAYVINVSGCKSGTTVPTTTGSSGPVTSTYGSSVPVRLIN